MRAVPCAADFFLLPLLTSLGWRKRTGANRVSWPNGCCEGDLVIIDFRDEQADGSTDGHTDGRTECGSERCADRCAYRRSDGCTD